MLYAAVTAKSWAIRNAVPAFVISPDYLFCLDRIKPTHSWTPNKSFPGGAYYFIKQSIKSTGFLQSLTRYWKLLQE